MKTKDEFTADFWANFKGLLKRKKMTQKDFCTKTGMNEKTLSSMIKRNVCPDVFFLALLHDTFRISFSSLMRGIPFEEAEHTADLTYKEKVVLNLLRTGTDEEEDRDLNMIGAMLVYQKGGSLHFLDDSMPQFEPILFGDRGIEEPTGQTYLFDFSKDLNEIEAKDKWREELTNSLHEQKDEQ